MQKHLNRVQLKQAYLNRLDQIRLEVFQMHLNRVHLKQMAYPRQYQLRLIHVHLFDLHLFQV